MYPHAAGFIAATQWQPNTAVLMGSRLREALRERQSMLATQNRRG